MAPKSPRSKTGSRGRGILSRREFARHAALAAAGVAALPGVLLGDAAAVAPEIAEFEQTPGTTSLPPASQAEVERTVQAIFAKYGSRLNDEQKADIRRLVAANQTNVDKLRAYALDNSDQPATFLKPLMERRPRAAGPPRVNKPKAS